MNKNHKNAIFKEWIHSAKEELHRWADENQVQDRSILRKKMAKIEELSKAKEVGLARLEATRVLAKQLEARVKKQ